MKIRKTKEKDIEEIYKLGKGEKYFSVNEKDPGFWPVETLVNWFDSPNGIMLVAENDEKEIVGFALANIIPEIKQVLFQNLFIKANYRKQGIAFCLIIELINEAKSKGVNYICGMTDITNEPMLNLCDKVGFEKGHAHFWMSKDI